ncbi:hypothetical protein ERD78_07125 [Allopusillimonas soli]|uniref:Uncharacterized protein n=1 Tax=Allopusillimonas soli TaxID=659016 RepID=A0A853FA32_9BURK|nr:hypothetical protein [Allopusillimonas soli]NYT36638.1 hypothetical protein [Allopusillimonas soli]TEA75123.1 hypothetical protein ERD78_07125 [Allopusillimonas soli]
MADLHPMIQLFEDRAKVLDASAQKADLDEGIVLLAGWLEGAKEWLSEDDIAILSEVGAIMYQEGLLARRMRGKS